MRIVYTHLVCLCISIESSCHVIRINNIWGFFSSARMSRGCQPVFLAVSVASYYITILNANARAHGCKSQSILWNMYRWAKRFSVFVYYFIPSTDTDTHFHRLHWHRWFAATHPSISLARYVFLLLQNTLSNLFARTFRLIERNAFLHFPHSIQKCLLFAFFQNFLENIRTNSSNIHTKVMPGKLSICMPLRTIEIHHRIVYKYYISL